MTAETEWVGGEFGLAGGNYLMKLPGSSKTFGKLTTKKVPMARDFRIINLRRCSILFDLPVPQTDPANEFILTLSVKCFGQWFPYFVRCRCIPFYRNRANGVIYINLNTIISEFLFAHFFTAYNDVSEIITPVHWSSRSIKKLLYRK